MANSTSNDQYLIDLKARYQELKEQVDESIQNVITAAGESLSATFDLEDIVTDFSVPDWGIMDVATIQKQTLGDLPVDWEGINIPAFVFNPEDYINADLLQRYSYTSDFFDNFLDERVRTYIDSQAYFLAQEVQDALFEQSRLRDLQTLNDSLDAVERTQARKGFPMPNSILMAARNEVIKKYQDTYADRNKEITALIADKSLQEKMHAMDTGIKMEDIRSRFQLEYGKLYWQAASYLIEKYKADVQAEMARVENELKMLDLNARIDIKNAEINVEETTLNNQKNMSRLQAEISEMSKQVELWIETYKARIKAAEEFVNYYKSAVLANLSSYNAIDYVDKKA